jgi:hypothetical protein
MIHSLRERIATDIVELFSTGFAGLFKGVGSPAKTTPPPHTKRGFHRNETKGHRTSIPHQPHVTFDLTNKPNITYYLCPWIATFLIFVKEPFIASTDLLPASISQLRSFRLSIVGLAKGNFSRKDCADAPVVPTTL